MACGTGKTLTSLKIIESLSITRVLYIVPSLSLLGQTIEAFNQDKEKPQRHKVVCSDRSIKTKENEEDILEVPSTSDDKEIYDFLTQVEKSKEGITSIVFSTYQSLDKLESYFKNKDTKPFDLVICDEAHRCSGLLTEDKRQTAGSFLKILDDQKIKRDKTLFMTATPKIYKLNQKTANTLQERSAALFSMDDESIFGEIFYEYNFSKAIKEGYLSDYKVSIVRIRSDEWKEKDTVLAHIESEPIQKALVSFLQENKVKKSIAFHGSIKDSKQLASLSSENFYKFDKFNEDAELSAVADSVTDSVTDEETDGLPPLSKYIEIRHVDGTMNSLKRKQELGWLRETSVNGEYKMLTNARCLSEGVDVPDVNGVLFLSEKKSPIDIVQAIGRCIRLAQDKDYGHIILPVIIPVGENPSVYLRSSGFKNVYYVLQALRSHDDRLALEIDQIRFGGKPKNIQTSDYNITGDKQENTAEVLPEAEQLNLFPEDAKLFFEILLKVGDREYFAKWVETINRLGEKLLTELDKERKNNPEFDKAFLDFHKSLKASVNKDITDASLEKMFVQHQITEPVFNSLFDENTFKQNAVYQEIEKVLSKYKAKDSFKDELKEFYENVKVRSSNIKKYSDKQKFLNELYEDFFKNFSKEDTKDQGIVYTPQELVRFMIRMVDDILQQEFDGRQLFDRNTHIIDPFTGTGNFIINILDSFQKKGISQELIEHKYKNELHCNDINLLPYYIASVNIEQKHQSMVKEYKPYSKICMVDTFLTIEEKQKEIPSIKEVNTKRIENQKKLPLKVILANPPYKKDKKGRYKYIDEQITKKFAKESKGVLVTSFYDHFYRAFIYADEKLKDNGIACYITNNQFIDKHSTNAFREHLSENYSAVYHFDFKGNARHLSKEDIKKQGGNVFGIMTGVGVTILVKNQNAKPPNKGIFLYRIDDYLKQKEKLEKIESFKSLKEIKFERITPQDSKWINLGRNEYKGFIPLYKDRQADQPGTSINRAEKPACIFKEITLGYKTNRDEWLIDYSKKQALEKGRLLTEAVNQAIESTKKNKDLLTKKSIPDPKHMNLNERDLCKRVIDKEIKQSFNENDEDLIRKIHHSPFSIRYLFHNRQLANSPGQFHRIFTNGTEYTNQKKNIGIALTKQSAGDFSALISDKMISDGFFKRTAFLPFYIEPKK